MQVVKVAADRAGIIIGRWSIQKTFLRHRVKPTLKQLLQLKISQRWVMMRRMMMIHLSKR